MPVTSFLPNLFSEFMDKIYKVDLMLKKDDRIKCLHTHEIEEKFKKALDAVKTSEEWYQLAVMIKIINQLDMNSPISLFNFLPLPDHCRNLSQQKLRIDRLFAKITFERAKRLFEHSAGGTVTGKYTNRHRYLEKAIRMVWELFPAGENNEWPYPEDSLSKEEACFFIAECYLYRSKLALPKGETVPEKKLEALTKAHEWCPKTSNRINDIFIEVALERDRWDKNVDPEWIKDILSMFLDQNNVDISNEVHLEALSRARELSLEKASEKVDQQILQLSPTEKNKMLPLYQAKAANRTGSEKLECKVKESVERLKKVPLSFHLWDDTVKFLILLSRDNRGGWMENAIRAWEICREEENRIKFSIQIRWYWARHAELYDLAFCAAVKTGDGKLAAEIADSLKSRPTIKRLAAEKHLSKADKKNKIALEKLREYETAWAVNAYHKGLSELKDLPSAEYRTRDVKDVPEGWTAVHFFLSSDDTGYAILLEKNREEIMQFEITAAYESFQRWWRLHSEVTDSDVMSEEERIKKMEETNTVLKKLCGETGRMLETAVSKISSDKIIFIPHGFLHLVPLHMAYVGGKPLFLSKKCLFLPSWTLAPESPQSRVTSKGILLTNWSEEYSKDPEFQKMLQNSNWKNAKKEKCSAQDCIEAIRKYSMDKESGLVVFYCHGMGSYINPYLSSLLMNNSSLTHQELVHLSTGRDILKGSGVILTACESDFVSGNFSLTDEHLSIANAFLLKGAGEVIGTLYKCMSDISLDIVNRAIEAPEKPLYETLHDIQTEKFINASDDLLYRIATFRTVGFPVEKEDDYA